MTVSNHVTAVDDPGMVALHNPNPNPNSSADPNPNPRPTPSPTPNPHPHPSQVATLIDAKDFASPSHLRWQMCAADRCFRVRALLPMFRGGRVLPVHEPPLGLGIGLGLG